MLKTETVEGLNDIEFELYRKKWNGKRAICPTHCRIGFSSF